MLRTCLLAIALLVLLPATARAEVRLRGDSQIDAETVTIGDLFDGTGAKADRAVGPAPAPGETATYRADHLVAIARAHGLDWRPANRATSAVISRAAHFLSTDVLEDALHRYLGEEQGDDLHIELTSRSARIPAPVDPEAPVDIVALDLDRASGRFSAQLAIPGITLSRSIFGRISTTIEMPVAIRTIRRGTTLGAADIEWRETRVDGLPAERLDDASSLIGMAAKRVIRAGRPIRRDDLTAPTLVTKGSLVTMSLESPGLTLTGTGRALEDGAEGDVIRIMNPRSKRTVEGTVVGPDMVKILPRRRVATSATE